MTITFISWQQPACCFTSPLIAELSIAGFPPSVSWALQTGLELGKNWTKAAIASSSLAITQTLYAKRRRMALPTCILRRTDTSGWTVTVQEDVSLHWLSAFLWWSRDLMHWMNSNTEQFISAKARYTDKVNATSPIKTFMEHAQIAPYSLQFRIIN